MNKNPFLLYIRERWKTAALLIVFILVFAVVFWLYGIASEAVGYALLLFFMLAILTGALDFFCFYRKHRTLAQMQKYVEVSLEDLPASMGPIEEDYQELLQKLYLLKAQSVSEADSRREEMMDYYTIWAHQIKTPIAAMDLLIQQGKAGAGTAELAQELFKIRQYVEMALQYLRMENMESDLLLKEYDLDDIVRQAVRKFASSFIYKKISLDFRETGLRVITDEKWMVFVLEQLLSNALKYTPSGKISIYADERRRQSENRMALVIEDTGIGIREEDLPRIFERGFTGRNGRLDKKATGLGLYLCREILRHLSHRISISSQAGAGTRVCLDLTADSLEVE